MNDFLTDIAGKHGENLVSAVLRYLLLSSPVVRNGVISLISMKAGIRPIYSLSHFSCYLEDSTFELKPQRGPDAEHTEAMSDNQTDAEPGAENETRGRIDIVIETDDAIVGLEAKLFAHFQEGQPFKYLRSLTDKATKLREIGRNNNIEAFVLVVVPGIREQEVWRYIEQRDRGVYADISDEFFGVLSWEEISIFIKAEISKGSLANDIRFVGKSLIDYLENLLSLHPSWKTIYPHLTKLRNGKLSALHKDVLWSISSLCEPSDEELGITNTKRQGGTGNRHTGRSIHFKDSDNYLWYGFESNHLSDGASEFIIVSTFPNVSNESQDGVGSYLEVDVAPKHISNSFYPNKEKHFWQIKFEPEYRDELANPMIWRNLLTSFIKTGAKQ